MRCFVQGLFMSTDAAGRAFSYTMVVGIGVTLFVTLLVALERLTQEVLHVQLPIVTGLALVVTIALLGPAHRPRVGVRAAARRVIVPTTGCCRHWARRCSPPSGRTPPCCRLSPV